VPGHPGFHSNARAQWLYGHGVLPEYRGRGIGRKLIDATLAEARRIGLKRIGLSAFADNARAIALYDSFGFKHEGRLRDYALIDGKYADFIMMSLVFRLDVKGDGGAKAA